jgi:hypothetical protein
VSLSSLSCPSRETIFEDRGTIFADRGISSQYGFDSGEEKIPDRNEVKPLKDDSVKLKPRMKRHKCAREGRLLMADSKPLQRS